MSPLHSYVVVWLLLIFAWATNFVIRVGFSALLPSIITELQLSYARAGLLASAFFYAYVLMQLPAGLLGDDGGGWGGHVQHAQYRQGGVGLHVGRDRVGSRRHEHGV